MKFYSSSDAFYVKSEVSVLKCCRISHKLSILKDFEECSEIDGLHEFEEIYGVIGVLKLDAFSFLMVITQCTHVANIPCVPVAKVYCIDRMVPVPIENTGPLNNMRLEDVHRQFRNKAQRKLTKFSSDKVYLLDVLDDILEMFNSNGNFYMCFERNITLNIQRYGKNALDRRDEFFWNKSLLNDLFDSFDMPIEGSNSWILPICQGFVTERHISLGEDSQLTIILISRRSVRRAGVRYLRRGIDVDGNVANFVETETIMSIFGHILSFLQVRGSVPIFWSQRGYRYRPPIRIDKSLGDSLPRLKQHFIALAEEYGDPVLVVNLVDTVGREMCLAVSYLDHILEMNSPQLSYYAFEFHQHCRALRFYKVNDLISKLSDELSSQGFCWVDKSGEMVRTQKGVVRTNCVDCLDRTNIVQCAISQAVCLKQAQKLGLVEPQCDAPRELIQCLMKMWADNGDALSRQYAGTNALKGDITRCGRRKMAGILRDSYNSASRYYLSHTHYPQRQLVIDTLLGNKICENNPGSKDEEEETEKSVGEEIENIKRIVHDTIRFVLPETALLLGTWALVDGSNLSDQLDTIVLLTKSSLMVTLYDDDVENVVAVQTLDFNDVVRLEMGTYGETRRIHLRIHTLSNQQFIWRAAGTRLFNNVGIPLKTNEECDEYIQAIGEQLKVTMSSVGRNVDMVTVDQLDGQIMVKPRQGLSSYLRNVFCNLDDVANKSLSHSAQYEKNDLATNLHLRNEGEAGSSNSDSILSQKAAAIVSKLQKLKPQLPRTQFEVIRQKPHGKLCDVDDIYLPYREKIIDSKSHVVLF